MPPKLQLHANKGKSKSFPKAVVPQNNAVEAVQSSSNTTNEEVDQQFEVELCWCIQKLEQSLQNKGLAPKIAQESMKVLNVLKNNSQPRVRKRQLMRMHFGDYRSKMAVEEKKSQKVEKVKYSTPSTKTTTSTFLKKSSFRSSTDNNFKFNFDIKIDDSNPLPVPNEESKCAASVEVESSKVPKCDNSTNRLTFNGGEFKFNFKIDEDSLTMSKDFHREDLSYSEAPLTQSYFQ